jgi:hypothetical protein
MFPRRHFDSLIGKIDFPHRNFIVIQTSPPITMVGIREHKETSIFTINLKGYVRRALLEERNLSRCYL